MMADAVRDVVGEAPINKSKVKIEVPPIVENGNSLPCTVSVESPASEYVKAIHVKNPQPYVIGLGPSAGRAGFSTRIRHADSQTVTVISPNYPMARSGRTMSASSSRSRPASRRSRTDSASTHSCSGDRQAR
jgi:predicted secreted protein